MKLKLIGSAFDLKVWSPAHFFNCGDGASPPTPNPTSIIVPYNSNLNDLTNLMFICFLFPFVHPWGQVLFIFFMRVVLLAVVWVGKVVLLLILLLFELTLVYA
jgi:hypothetical protein